jgi:hypothetical protein
MRRFKIADTLSGIGTCNSESVLCAQSCVRHSSRCGAGVRARARACAGVWVFTGKEFIRVAGLGECGEDWQGGGRATCWGAAVEARNAEFIRLIAASLPCAIRRMWLENHFGTCEEVHTKTAEQSSRHTERTAMAY